MSKERNVIKRLQRQENRATPQTPIGTNIYIPNHSGDHSRGRVLTTPTTDYEIVNKKYVDDSSSSWASQTPDAMVYVTDNGFEALDLSDGSVISTGTDEATVIQAAIDQLEVTGYGHLHIKSGSYVLDTPLTINGHIRITGDGQEATELKAKDSLNDDMIQINSTKTNSVHWRVMFADIKFDGNDANQTDGSTILAHGIIQSHFIRCHWENFYDYALHLYDCKGDGTGAYGHHNQIIDCLFDQSSTSGLGTAIYMRANDENVISHSQFQYCVIGIKDEVGFNTISNCSFVNQGQGVHILDCSRTRVVNNVFDLVTKQGVYCKGSFNIISNNTFYGNSNDDAGTYSCVDIDWYGSNIVSNNVFIAPDADTKAGIEETGDASEDTYGQNLFANNYFLEANTATGLGGAGWGTSAFVETNTNLKFGNVIRDASDVTTVDNGTLLGYDHVNTRVGINTASPLTTFHCLGDSLFGESTGKSEIYLGSAMTANNSLIIGFDNDTTKVRMNIYGDASPKGINIDDGGFVGINTTSPSTELDVGGDATIQGMLNLAAPTELTIATGAITVTKTYHTIDTESDAASDDLDTINGGSEGDILIIRAISSARTVVAKDGTGNLALAGDFSMDVTGDALTLLHNGTTWQELSRSNNA